MHVLMVHNDYLIPGGETITMREEVSSLRSAGIDVTVLEVNNARWLQSTGLRAAGRLVYTPQASELITRAIHEHKPDLVHSHNLFPSLGAAAMQSLATSGLPWVQHVHNYRYSCLSANHFRDGADCFRCTSSARALPGIVHGCYRGSRGLSAGVAMFDVSRRGALRLRHSPTLYLTVSQTMRDTVLRMSPRIGPVRVLYNSVDTAASAQAIAKRQSRDGVVIVGRLAEEKGVLLALSALDLIPETKVVIIGDGALHDDVSAWVKARPGATLIRRAENAEVLTRLAAGQVALSLSLWEEPFGRTALEAVSVGTPVIATSRGAAREVLDDSVATILSRTPSKDNVATAIRDRLGAPPDADAEIARMHQWVRSRFSPEVVAAGLSEVYCAASEMHYRR